MIAHNRNQRGRAILTGAPRGTLEALAGELGVSHSLVSRVNRGLATSERVASALRAKCKELLLAARKTA